MDSTTQVFSILVILLTLFVTAALPRRRYTLRRIPAFEALPGFVGLSIESNRPLHLSIGSAGIGGGSTLLAIAGAEVAYQMAQRAAIGDVSPIFTLSDTTAIPLGQDTLRRAYNARNATDRYKPRNVRWYPAGERSLAFAAALTALINDDDVSSNVLAGSFGPEIGLVIEASYRRDIPVIAVSDDLEGQAVAYAMTEQALIGEEIFAGASYLDDDPRQVSESVTVDVLRWIVVITMLIGLVLNIIGSS